MAADSEEELPEVTLSEFFETKPANVTFRISINEDLDMGIAFALNSLKSDSFDLRLPSIRLWCDAAQCQNVRVCEAMTRSLKLQIFAIQNSFVEFECCDCRQVVKKYALWFQYRTDLKQLLAGKLGEDPPLSPRLPSRLRKLVGTDQEKLEKGLRSEKSGLGVGAFAYYRQIVENQKNRLIDEIIKVANLQNPPSKLIEELEEARRQNQFSSAVEKIKHAIPEVLLINDNNPLTLLHKALSEGLHAATDEECLEIAQDIRVVLSELSERLHTALKDDQELKKAVSRIQNRPKKGR